MAHKGDASTRTDRIFLADPEHSLDKLLFIRYTNGDRQPSEATKYTIIYKIHKLTRR